MLTTPARFEEEVDKIIKGESQGNVFLEAFALMVETLNSLGYEAGTEKFMRALYHED